MFRRRKEPRLTLTRLRRLLKSLNYTGTDYTIDNEGFLSVFDKRTNVWRRYPARLDYVDITAARVASVEAHDAAPRIPQPYGGML